MKIKTLFGALGVAAAMAMAPMAAQAVPISGQLDITGNLNSATTEFTPTGLVDFDPETAVSTVATGTFAPLVTTVFEGGAPTSFALTDIDFTAAPGLVYSGGGITFTATSFGGFDDIADPVRGFFANGIISIAGFDDTEGVLTVSTQAGKGTGQISFSSTTVIPLPAGIVFLLTALGGLGFVARRRAKLA